MPQFLNMPAVSKNSASLIQIHFPQQQASLYATINRLLLLDNRAVTSNFGPQGKQRETSTWTAAPLAHGQTRNR